MFVHTTIIRVKPENVQKVVEDLTSGKQNAYFATIHGIRHGFLLEATDEPGKLISLSFWDTPADAMAVFADPNYSMLIAELRNNLVAAPERFGYHLLADLPFEKPVMNVTASG